MNLKRENSSRSTRRAKKTTPQSTKKKSSDKTTQRRSRTQSSRALAKRGGQKSHNKNGRFNKNNKQQKPKTSTHKLHDQLKVMIIGGNQEVGGKNMTVIEYEKDIIIIDMGLKFPEEDMHGIDYIIPNISYLKGREKDIRAVTLTHGHLDHIGGVSHLIPELGNPTIYTGKFTAAMIKRRHEEHKNVPKLNVKVCDENSHIKAGKMMIEFVPLNHSIPDTFGILVHTPVGSIFHTGDFKFDFSPVYGEPADLARLSEIGSKGVLALLSDSTGAIKPGFQISEKIVGEELEKVFSTADKRIFVGTVASNLSRLIQILQIAEKLGRKVALEGRSIKNIVDIAFELGYLKLNRKMIIEAKQVRKYPPHEVMVVCTGSQGEPNAVLPRIVAGDHPHLSLDKGDTIVFSASIIPGNEVTVSRLLDGIYRHGCKVFNYRMMAIHAGGHGNAEDGKLMIRLMQPKYFVPIEGSYSFLAVHGESAESVGVPRENIFLADNGQIMEFYKPKGKKDVVGVLTDVRVETDDVLVDGLGVGDVSSIVLRDRQVMAEDGMFVVIVTINAQTGQMIGNPDIISRGFVYMKENKQLIEGARRKVKTIFKKYKKPNIDGNDFIKGKMRDEISLYLYKNIKRRPMVLPVVIDV